MTTHDRSPAGMLSAAQAARQLGVKPQTLYAYVSRGLLRSERGPDGRGSLFHANEVQRLALRGRRANGVRPGPAITSALTLIEDGAYYYRGRNALALAQNCAFEEVAGWLWLGAWPPYAPWRAPAAVLALGERLQAVLPPAALPLDRMHALAAVLGAADDLRFDVRPEGAAVAGRALLAALVDSLPRVGEEPTALVLPDRAPLAGALAARLWARLGPTPPAPGMLALLNTALVLLADHELPLSTFAARIAAAARADPYAVVACALGVVGGVRHGGASLAVEALLRSIVRPEDAAAVIGARLRRGEPLPGFGHPLYPAGDPRAALLLRLLTERAAEPRLAVAQAVLAAANARGLPPPNVDFALGTLAAVAGWCDGAAEAVFALARCAGWLAHALEEYAGRSALRPRAIYVGPPPVKG